MKLQDPPQERLQLVEALQELQEQHREAVYHQVPLVPQICRAGNVPEGTKRARVCDYG